MEQASALNPGIKGENIREEILGFWKKDSFKEVWMDLASDPKQREKDMYLKK